MLMDGLNRLSPYIPCRGWIHRIHKDFVMDSVKFSGGVVWSVKRKFDQVKLSLYTPKQKSSQVLDTNFVMKVTDRV